MADFFRRCQRAGKPGFAVAERLGQVSGSSRSSRDGWDGKAPALQRLAWDWPFMHRPLPADIRLLRDQGAATAMGGFSCSKALGRCREARWFHCRWRLDLAVNALA